jgi:tRNA 2-selenouridine synthase
MHETNVPLQEFLDQPGTIFDVRSPSEYHQGRIPGAHNLPLFSDSERAAVGTLYKQSGKQQAIELGLSYAGPKFADFIKYIKGYKDTGVAKIHCWRGGMRSQAISWLVNIAGYSPVTLTGGYKVFRRWVLSSFTSTYNFRILGGYTGSGKTEVLQELKKLGEQVLDLEHLACHRGSAFGSLNQPTQPSIEQFENEIAMQLRNLLPEKPIWIEDESRMIGKCKIPDGLFHQMRTAPLIFMETSKEQRVQYLLKQYGRYSPELLVQSAHRLVKRLGGQRTQQLVYYFQAGQLEQAISLCLDYYDSTYAYGLSRRCQHPPICINTESCSPAEIAHRLVDHIRFLAEAGYNAR